MNVSPKDWLTKMDNALWAYWTTFKIPIRASPHRLVFGTSCQLPMELDHRAYWVTRKLNIDFQVAEEKRMLQVNELDEFWYEAYENSKICNEITKAWHDKHIMRNEFQPRQQVLKCLGKLKSRWSRPFFITQVFPYGSVELSHLNKENFMVNGKRLKLYFGGEVDLVE